LDFLLKRYLWLAAMPPIVLACAILAMALLTAVDCNPLYRAAPATATDAAAMGREGWAAALGRIDRASTHYLAARARGAALGVCP